MRAETVNSRPKLTHLRASRSDPPPTKEGGAAGLDQTGNRVRWKLDKNGDGDFTDANDFDEKRTHNAANELLTRNTNNSGAVEHTTTIDAVGNMTDDGNSYTYEFDPLGRLVRVRNRTTNALVAEYAYYGNGYRASEKYDTDVDGDVDGADLTYYFVYDDAWRLVATHRSSDVNPKEQFIPNLAGLDGSGSASLLDDVVLRNRDESSAWTSASDGTLETRRYFCQNWRGDVIALLTASGAQVEEVRYSPYGEPFGMYAGDVDDDGDVDATDRGQVGTWIAGGTYDVRGDLDRDGDVDTADRNTVNANIGKNLGWGAQSHSSAGNRRGYAGYESGLANVGLQHVRFRAYRTDLGRWLSRDPLGFDGLQSLYAYATNGAIAQIDPLGLAGVVPPAAPIPSDQISQTDDAGPSLKPPGSGLELGFVVCPDFKRFGGQGLPPGVNPVPDAEWYVLEPAHYDRKTLRPWFGRRPWQHQPADIDIFGLGLMAVAADGACRSPQSHGNNSSAAGSRVLPVFAAVVLTTAITQMGRDRDWYDEVSRDLTRPRPRVIPRERVDPAPLGPRPRKRSDCYCMCMSLDGRGEEKGPIPKGRMSRAACLRVPREHKVYTYCYCKGDK